MYNIEDFFIKRFPGDDLSIQEILYKGLIKKSNRTVLYFENFGKTTSEMADAVGAIQLWLKVQGLTTDSKVALMLDNHIEHILIIYALTLSGIAWVPINTKLRTAGIQYIIEDCRPDLLIVENNYHDYITDACAGAYYCPELILREKVPLKHNNSEPIKIAVKPNHVQCIIYTSGTTGAPKGVLFTHRMMRIASESVIIVADVKRDDKMFLWEPLCHIGGAQMLIVPFLEFVELHIVKKFSASNFWNQIKRSNVTHLHYLGGILDILMHQRPEYVPEKHSIRTAWGAGVSANAWEPIIKRFNLQLRECYGLTECSSFATVNKSGKPGSIGRPLPWLEIELLDSDLRKVDTGQIGQIVLSTKVDGAFFKRYLNNDEATFRTLNNEKLYTGDLARQDKDGDFFFVGRLTDSIRVKGENVSAWEVERVFLTHPSIRMTAAVGVKSDIGEQDIKLFVQYKAGEKISFEELCQWAELRLATFQLPRYYMEVDRFEITPSERIRKHLLSKDAIGWKRN